MIIMNEAIEFVMSFYNISREDAINLYWDEVEAFMQLIQNTSELNNEQ